MYKGSNKVVVVFVTTKQNFHHSLTLNQFHAGDLQLIFIRVALNHQASIFGCKNTGIGKVHDFTVTDT